MNKDEAKKKEKKDLNKKFITTWAIVIAMCLGAGELLACLIINYIPAYTALALKIAAPCFIFVLILIFILAKEKFKP
jgi:hypothetical protein